MKQHPLENAVMWTPALKNNQYHNRLPIYFPSCHFNNLLATVTNKYWPKTQIKESQATLNYILKLTGLFFSHSIQLKSIFSNTNLKIFCWQKCSLVFIEEKWNTSIQLLIAFYYSFPLGKNSHCYLNVLSFVMRKLAFFFLFTYVKHILILKIFCLKPPCSSH